MYTSLTTSYIAVHLWDWDTAFANLRRCMQGFCNVDTCKGQSRQLRSCTFYVFKDTILIIGNRSSMESIILRRMFDRDTM